MSISLQPVEWQRDDFGVTTDPGRLDMEVIHDFLANESYWSRGIPRATLQRSIGNSLGFALLHDNRQFGFTALTDPDRFMELYDPDVYRPPRKPALE